MPAITIDPGDRTKLISQPAEADAYNVDVSGSAVYLSHNPRAVVRDGKKVRRGDRVEISNLRGKPVYAKVPSDASSSATVEVDRAGFALNFFPRAVQATVQTDNDDEAAPRTDAFVHEYGSAVDVNASDEVINIDAPDRADFLVIHVDDAIGDYDVSVAFMDPDGNEITTRTSGDNSDLSGNASTDVFGRVAIAAPKAQVTISDTSGASNTLDYSIYAR